MGESFWQRAGWGGPQPREQGFYKRLTVQLKTEETGSMADWAQLDYCFPSGGVLSGFVFSAHWPTAKPVTQ